MSLTYVPTTNTTASLNTMASNFISTGYSTVFIPGNIPTGYSATVNTLANILSKSSSCIINYILSLKILIFVFI